MSFRILALDGGGVRGYLSAQILANIESYLNKVTHQEVPIGDRFDLIAGTSTGGIIALGLAKGLSAATIAEFYLNNSASIFPEWDKKNWVARKFSPSYTPDRLRLALKKVFSDEETLRDLRRDVSVVAVTLANAKPRLHKTDFLPRNDSRLDESLLNVALSTAAAPTYYPAHSGKHSSNLVDGGVCANNPAMVAVVDAMQFARQSKRGVEPPASMQDIALLSVGTGEACAMPYDFAKLAKAGELYWGRYFFEVSIESQSQLVHFQAKFLVKNYLRVNPQLRFAMALDEHDKLEELKNLADLNSDIETFVATHYA